MEGSRRACGLKQKDLLKTLIFHPDTAARKAIRRQIEYLDHVVMHEGASVQQILLHVSKHQPHVIIIAEFDPVLRIQIETLFDQLALRSPIIWLPLASSGFELEALIQRELSKISSAPLTPPLVRYCDDFRQVIRDIGYVAYEDGGKQNLPPASENESEELAREKGIFAQQVERATRNHAAARHYLRQVMVTDRGGGGLQRELVYRAVHSSHKIFWERDHIYRWVGVLAHYLPGVGIPAATRPAIPEAGFSSPQQQCGVPVHGNGAPTPWLQIELDAFPAFGLGAEVYRPK